MTVHAAPATSVAHDTKRELRVKGVTKRFGGTVALTRVDIVVRPSVVHALIGPNGAGKSTLVNVIAGSYTADEGEVWLGDGQITALGAARMRRAGIARTFQRCRIFPSLTCEENVRVGAYTTGAGQARAERSVDELMRWARLDDRRHSRAGSLALAEQRRLEIARALAAPADVLLLDEPTAGMGAHETAEVQQLVRDCAERFGMGVLLVAHDMPLVMAVSDEITVLDFGRVIAAGTPDAVRANPRVIEAYLGPADE